MRENNDWRVKFKEFCLRFDLFSKPVRSFTIKGQRDIATVESTIMTFIFTISMLAMISSKINAIVTHRNYKIQIEQLENYHDSDYKLNLQQTGFHIAFAVRSDDGQFKDDPNFVKWVARVSTKIDDQESYVLLKTHYCT